MVGFGQVICVPVGPRCEYVSISSSVCAIGQARRCPSRRKVDEKARLKRVPIYYRDGTVDKGYGRMPLAKQEEIDAVETSKLATTEPTQPADGAGADSPPAGTAALEW